MNIYARAFLYSSAYSHHLGEHGFLKEGPPFWIGYVLVVLLAIWQDGRQARTTHSNTEGR